ncbi:LepB GTPase-activating domain-containing protein [Legionella norrlandica]|uniref:LepB GTPase-activating domain-containing protein n=1 Tax=Legionella norrlandica TaxID=1498499 RepID=UPI0009DD7CA1|nr:LepB GTPase-activating domain-containing protein [Legionella norrlandica]
MFSLLLGAHSVHSGNIVVLKDSEKEKNKQFGRIDWGDAFRYFAHHQNNDNLLYAYENRGLLNYKKLTKDYFLNYKKINGLFPAMAEKAQQLQSKLNHELLTEIVTSALKNIPTDMISEETQKRLAKYMCMDSFGSITFGPEGHCAIFAAEMAKLLEDRLGKISLLKDISPSENMYQSIIEIKPLTLPTESSMPFSETVKQWSDILKTPMIENSPFDGNSLDLSKLSAQFNLYVNQLAATWETNNIWENKESINVNMFTPYDHSGGEAIHGHAFVPFYKESVVLRHLFSIDPMTLNLSRFAAFEKPCQLYSREHQDSVWVKAQTLLTLGNGIINTLKVIKQAQAFGMDDAVSENIKSLKVQLGAFQEAERNLGALTEPSLENVLPNQESSFFYPIPEEELNKMSGYQLATICLEELSESTPSPLIERILSNNKLWERIELAFASDVFKGRMDNPSAKIAKINEWHQLLQFSTRRTSEMEETIIDLKQLLQQRTAEISELLLQSKEISEKYQEQQKRAELSEQELQQLTQNSKTTHSRLTQQVDSLSLQLEEKLLQIQQLEQQIAENEKENQELQRKAKLSEDAKSLAQNSADSLEKELEKLQAQLKELQGELQQANINNYLLSQSSRQTNVLQKLVQTQTKELEELQKTITQITQEKSLAESSLSSLRKEFQQLTEESEQTRSYLTTQISTVNQQLEEKLIKIQQLEQKLSEKEKRNHELQEKIKTSESEKSFATHLTTSLAEEVKNLKFQLKQLQEKLQESEISKYLLNQTSQQISSLQELVQKQTEELEELQKTTKQVTQEKSLAESSLSSLQEKLQQVTGKSEEVRSHLAKQINTLSQQLEEKLSKIQQLEQQLLEKEEKNQDLQRKVKTSEHETSSAQLSIASLTKEIEKLQSQLKTLQGNLQEKDMRIHSLSQPSQQIPVLQELVQKQTRELEDLNGRLQQLLSDNRELSNQKHILSEENSLNRNNTQDLKKKLSQLTDQLEQLQQALSEKEQTVRELREELIKVSIEDNEEMQFAQNRMREEIQILQEKIRQQQFNINQLQSIISQNKEAEKRYEAALQQQKGIYIARMERIAPIFQHITLIEQKAKELKARKEEDAYNAANILAINLHTEIKNYLDNKEPDETKALESFKINTKVHIDKSKKVLNQHREEWKYILANVTLGVLLLGVGYLAAILINKRMTCNYTFFSCTDSGSKVKKLEETIASTPNHKAYA